MKAEKRTESRKCTFLPHKPQTFDSELCQGLDLIYKENVKTRKGWWEHCFRTLFFILGVVCSWQERGQYAFCREVKRLWAPQGVTSIRLCSSGPSISFKMSVEDWDASGRAVHLEAGVKIQNARPDRTSIPPTRLQRPQGGLSRYTVFKGIHL